MIGNYTEQTLPWPSFWKVYVSRNIQIGTNGNVFQFELAADPSTVDPTQYDGNFNVSDFVSTGSVVWYNLIVPNKYTVTPDGTQWFAGTING